MSVAASPAMNLHEFLRRYELSDTSAMGLDTSVVSVETVPLIINTTTGRRIARVSNVLDEDKEKSCEKIRK